MPQWPALRLLSRAVAGGARSRVCPASSVHTSPRVFSVSWRRSALSVSDRPGRAPRPLCRDLRTRPGRACPHLAGRAELHALRTCMRPGFLEGLFFVYAPSALAARRPLACSRPVIRRDPMRLPRGHDGRRGRAPSSCARAWASHRHRRGRRLSVPDVTPGRGGLGDVVRSPRGGASDRWTRARASALRGCSPSRSSARWSHVAQRLRSVAAAESRRGPRASSYSSDSRLQVVEESRNEVAASILRRRGGGCARVSRWLSRLARSSSLAGRDRRRLVADSAPTSSRRRRAGLQSPASVRGGARHDAGARLSAALRGAVIW